MADLDFLLIGKWTQDRIEKVFGDLRCMSSRNFYLQVLQADEVLRKMRNLRLMKLCECEKDISIFTEERNEASFQPSEGVAKELVILIESAVEEGDIDEAEHYVAGFCGHSVSKWQYKRGISCEECLSRFLRVEERGLMTRTNNYQDLRQAGGLKVATPFASKLVKIITNAVSMIMDGSDDRMRFLAANVNQVTVVRYLAQVSLNQIAPNISEEECTSCLRPGDFLAQSFINALANTIVKGVKNQVNNESALAAPKKKLTSLAREKTVSHGHKQRLFELSRPRPSSNQSTQAMTSSGRLTQQPTYLESYDSGSSYCSNDDEEMEVDN